MIEGFEMKMKRICIRESHRLMRVSFRLLKGWIKILFSWMLILSSKKSCFLVMILAMGWRRIKRLIRSMRI
jgi:hypothetical protein